MPDHKTKASIKILEALGFFSMWSIVFAALQRLEAEQLKFAFWGFEEKQALTL